MTAAMGERARAILADWERHFDDPAVCDSYYCGQGCSYLDEVDARAVELLQELAEAGR